MHGRLARQILPINSWWQEYQKINRNEILRMCKMKEVCDENCESCKKTTAQQRATENCWRNQNKNKQKGGSKW